MKEESNNNYCVYQHVCPNGKIYIGVTKNVEHRWFPSQYKRTNTPFKDAIIEFGWKNIKHQVVASGLTHNEALKLEDSLIVNARENGNSLNVKRSGHYQQTEEFKEKEKVRSKTYYEAHPEECNRRSKAWRETHPDYNREYLREWRKRKKEQRNNNNDK